MRFEYHKYEQLPKLAWCSIIEKGKEIVRIYCGPWVETFENFFVEGVWDDDFESANFDKSIFLLGSGGKVDNGIIKFATPSHTLERLHLIKSDNVVYISNSLAFVLEISKKNLDINYLDYEKDFASILQGINRYKDKIPLENNEFLYIYYYCNIICDRDLNIRKEKKIIRDDFNDFNDYYNSIRSTLIKLKNNANSKMRIKKFGVVTTISSGYDASMCAAMAKEIGCDIALTFNEPKKYSNDSGENIAKALGYTTIIKKNANDYLNRDDLIEAEYLSSGELGSSIIFSAFEDEFRGKLVLIGERGDKIWDKNRKDVNRELRFENEIFTNTSMIENRLKVGYIIVPLPLYAATNWPSIHKISNSEEMQYWSLGNDYDRPIPRRILEEKGVERHMFGVEKKGAGFNYRYDNLSRIKSRMSQNSFQSFYKFYKQNRNKRNLLNKYKHIVKFIIKTYPVYLNWIFSKFKIKIKLQVSTEKLCDNPFSPSYLIHWGLEITKQRYNLNNLD